MNELFNSMNDLAKYVLTDSGKWVELGSIPVAKFTTVRKISVPMPTKIISNPPYTIVFFDDGTKQVVKCADDVEYTTYGGFVNALAVKMFGNNSRLKKFISGITVETKNGGKKKPEKQSDRIVFYTTGCPQCRSLKAMLDNGNIAHETCSDKQTMLDLGIEAVPAISVNGTIMNFEEAKSWLKERGDKQ